MECTLATLIACFSWSNLYIDTQFAYLDVQTTFREWQESTIDTGSAVETVGQYVYRSENLSPYGGVAVGFSVPIHNVTVSLEASHTSSLETSKDRGINAISLRARWFPLRR